jgi:hypothetical protein
MALRFHKAKRDACEPSIVEALQAAGASVYRLDQPVDLLIGYRGKCIIAECKLSGAKLNENQLKFFSEWRGSTPPILRSVDDALKLLEAMNG